MRINYDMYGNSKGSRSEWATPQDLFDRLNAEFHFTLDAAASKLNHKCEKFFTVKDNGLKQPWSGTVWCNPPYGKAVPLWLQKAIEEQAHGVTSVFLVFARTDTGWFHDLVLPHAEIRFLRGRVKFVHPTLGTGNNPALGSMVLVFRGKHAKKQRNKR
jgi:phage N-6-adenine-methyltransferase